MKKKFIGLAILILGAAIYLKWHRTENSFALKPVKKQIVPKATSLDPKTMKEVPVPASLIPKLRGPASVSDGPEPLAFEVEKEKLLRVSKNWSLILDISVMDKKKYRPEFGKKLLEDKYFIFFRSPVNQKDAWPVAYDPSRQRLYPVSHILHIKGVDESERLQFRAEGMSEYYYHARMQYLSVQSTPRQVVKDYEILKERGFDVRMEVLKEGVKPN